MRNAIDFDFGTPALGGNTNFYKVTLDTIKYTPLFWDTRHSIGRFRQVVGLNDKPIPLTELYFVGGINTMRGFSFGRAGPVTPENSLLGADREIIINKTILYFQFRAKRNSNGVIFFDYGKGFGPGEPLSFHLRSAAGLELRWISPLRTTPCRLWDQPSSA